MQLSAERGRESTVELDETGSVREHYERAQLRCIGAADAADLSPHLDRSHRAAGGNLGDHVPQIVTVLSGPLECLGRGGGQVELALALPVLTEGVNLRRKALDDHRRDQRLSR